MVADIFGGEVGIMLDGRIKDSSGNICVKDKNMLVDWYNKIKVYNL